MRRTTFIAAFIAIALVLGACSSGGDDEADTTTTEEPTTTTAPSKPADAKAARAEITANFQTFFADGTSMDQRVALLEDGEALRATLEAAEATSPPGVSVAVKKVTFTGVDSADVTFDVIVNGSPALADFAGQALYLDGVWKVARKTNCDLLSLGGTTCPAA